VDLASLKDLFEQEADKLVKHYYNKNNSKPFYKKIYEEIIYFFYNIFIKLGLKEEQYKHIDRKLFPITAGFICPHCLKYINYGDINITCPFCDSIYKNHNKNIIAQYKDTKFVVCDSAYVIFRECFNCCKPIKYITCYHCDKEINLLAPYNEEELELKRYE